MPHMQVIYGDTDSLFILMKGSSMTEAMKHSKTICKLINKQLPHPMEIKFEKILKPFVAFAKKRYVGWKLTSETDKGSFLTKGVEMSRRDGCPALVKIFRESVSIMFETGDLSKLKQYLQT